MELESGPLQFLDEVIIDKEFTAGAQVDNGFFSRGYVLEEGSDAEKVLSQAHAVSFGSSLESFVTPGYLDGRVFVLYDDCPCLVYGPVSKDIHAFDERVSLASVQRITGTIALFIANWCGLEKLR